MFNKTNSLTEHDYTATGVRTFDLQLFAEGEATEAADTASTTGTATDTAASEATAVQNTDAADTATEEKGKVAGAPDEYGDFTPPEGLTYDSASAAEFKEVAKELNLTQDQAQKLADLYGKNMLSMQKQQAAQSEQWYNDSVKEFKQEELDLAAKTLGRFATPEFKEFLVQSGLGNHKEMIRVFKNMGAKISEGKFVDTAASPASNKPLYSNSPGMYK